MFELSCSVFGSGGGFKSVQTSWSLDSHVKLPNLNEI